ncbi:quinolinate synthase NadA [Alkaliphilus peptidifermentans]|uniref:Quinolinate synthase n=1 Tax=Alkaliphilus peptidifermentans DSM 18978 TaxID=1120976 RepID=A0A1G5AXR4_9FIRM|nr:quinolinate synthase NadA [Alkaliphilus peptidifermentans]SCX82653.1 quinolinate synthetase [Alkaliphilus peptidifermentans DSM 18978]
MSEIELIEEIRRLKKLKNAIILAHNYQIPEIQDIADVVGDSLKLSQEAAKTKAEIIILSGVSFMAESAKILSPNKKVLLPVYDAGCPMADMIDVNKLKQFKREYPNAPVVCYVNSSAEVKAESDICCTSSNALKVIRSLSSNKVLFIPDMNLGDYIAKQLPQKEIISWKGFCITHHRVKTQEALASKKSLPEAPILAHPECSQAVVALADFVGSTSQIINYVRESSKQTFIIGTEMGVLHQLNKENPDKKFYLLSQGLICTNMKKTRLKDIYEALLTEKNEILIDEVVRLKAFKSLNRMLNLS